jgi:anti-sigma factor RsiW
MNLLSDEILNKYLDGELDKNQSAEVEEILNKSENYRKRLSALNLIHKELTFIQ